MKKLAKIAVIASAAYIAGSVIFSGLVNAGHYRALQWRGGFLTVEFFRATADANGDGIDKDGYYVAYNGAGEYITAEVYKPFSDGEDDIIYRKDFRIR